MTINPQIIEWQKEQRKVWENIGTFPRYQSIDNLIAYSKKVIARLRDERTRINEKRTSFDGPMAGIQSCLNDIGFNVFQYAVDKRIIEGDPKYYLDGIYTSRRLSYISGCLYDEKYRSFAWGSALMVLAGKDQALLDVYMRQFPVPKDVISRSLYFALRDDPADEAAVQAVLEESAGRKTLALYYKYLVQCFVCIHRHDSDGLSKVLEIVTQKSWGMRNSLFIESITSKGIPIFSHGIYNLAKVIFRKHNIPCPPPPHHELWDTQYDAYISRDDVSADFIYNISEISPYLSEVMQTLPKTIDIFSI